MKSNHHAYAIFIFLVAVLAQAVQCETTQLLPNAINKAYYNTTLTSSPTAWIVNTEFDSTNYNQVNTSNDVRYSQSCSWGGTGTRYNFYRFTFNLSSIPREQITEVVLAHEGFFRTTFDTSAALYYHNFTSGSWTYLSGLNPESDTIVTRKFTGSALNDVISSGGIVQFGLQLICSQFLGGTTSYTDFAYLNVTYTIPCPDYSFNVSWVYPANNTWNTTSNIIHGFIPLWNCAGITSCSLWSNSTGAFELKTSNSTPLSNNTINTITYDYTNDNAQIYSYINCTNSLGNSNFTRNYTIKIDKTPPTKPTLTTNSVGTTWIALNIGSCSDSTSGVDKRLLYRNNTNIQNFTGGGGTIYNDTGLLSGTTYAYNLSCLDNVGWYSENSTNINTTSSAPTPSLNVTPSSSNCGAVFYRVRSYNINSKPIDSSFTVRIIDPSIITVLTQSALYPNNGTGVYLGRYLLNTSSAVGTWLLKVTESSGVSSGKNFHVRSVVSVCGDGYCTSGENCQNCPADCSCHCGDGVCTSGENCNNCNADCGCPPPTTCCDCYGIYQCVINCPWGCPV